MQIARSELDHQIGRFADSEQSARTAADRLARIAETPGTSPEPLDSMFRAMAEMRVAIALRELGRVDDAIVQHDIAVDRLSALAKLSSSRDVLLHHHQARTERALTLSVLPARRTAALADLDESVRGCEALAREFPDAPSYLRYQGLGTLYRGQLKSILGDRRASGNDLTAAAKMFEVLVSKYVDIPVYRGDLGRTYLALGENAADTMIASEWYNKARGVLADAIKRSPDNAIFRRILSKLNELAKASP